MNAVTPEIGRTVRVGRSEFTLVDIQPVHPLDVIVSYVRPSDEMPGPSFTFGYFVSPIEEHPNYVLIQAAVAVCDPRDKFVKSTGRMMVQQMLSDTSRIRHQVFSVHFPAASLLRTYSHSRSTRFEFPGSRLIQDAIQIAIMDNYNELVQQLSSPPEIEFEDEDEDGFSEFDSDVEVNLSKDFPGFVHPSNLSNKE
jgi:hypothetical protein